MRKMFRLSLILFSFILFVSMVSADCNSGQIDINSASLEELDEIIWVGPATAQKIIDARSFESVDDLIKVSGIGDIKLEDIKQQGLACVSGGAGVEEGVEEEIKEDKTQIAEENEENATEIEKGIEEIVIDKTNENIIILNSGRETEQNRLATGKVVYESKNEKIKNYAIYFFAGFLIFVIVVLLIRG